MSEDTRVIYLEIHDHSRRIETSFGCDQEDDPPNGIDRHNGWLTACWRGKRFELRMGLRTPVQVDLNNPLKGFTSREG